MSFAKKKKLGLRVGAHCDSENARLSQLIFYLYSVTPSFPFGNLLVVILY